MTDSKKIDDGGPAFPQHDLSGYGFGPSERGEHGDEPEDFGTRHYTVEGMSLRDWFAGQALNGMISVSVFKDGTKYSTIALSAYEWADAMIAARKAGA